MNHNVAQHLQRHIAAHPDRLALIPPQERTGGLTFAELGRRVDAVAHGLAARGVGPGERVVVMTPMSVDLYVLLIALLKLGAVAVFIDPWVGLKQLDHCCRMVEPKAFIGMPLAHGLRLLSRQFRRIPVHAVARPGLKALMAANRAPFPVMAAAAEAPALITFTTGSSGMPKGVNRTHGFLWAQHEALRQELDQQAGDVDLPAFPIMLLNNLAGGITSVLPDMHPSRPSQVDPRRIVAQIRRHGVTTASGSPAFWQPVARWCLDHGVTLPNLRRVHTGGAPVSPTVVATVKQILPAGECYVVYGSTEAEPVALISGSEVLAETAAGTASGQGACVGRPAPMVALKIVKAQRHPIRLDEDGWKAWEMSPGAIGEVVVSGDHVGRGYWHDPEADRQHKIVAGDRIWHRMGDLGYLDEAGRLWLVGRIHNVVERNGRRYYPFQVEAMAQAIVGVRQAALVGLPDAALGERMVLVVNGNAPAAVVALQRAGIPIDRVVQRASIPVDPRHNAKIDYVRLRRDLGR